MGSPTRPWSWLADPPRRARIEAAARSAYPELRYRRRQRAEGPVHLYDMDIPVPGYETCYVTVEILESRPSSPRVFADRPAGPDASPHRFATRGYRQLCIWHPDDPAQRRWVPDDGLLTLFGMIAHHLFKEGWWRETGGFNGGEWLGDQCPHGPLTDANDSAAQEAAR